MTEETDAPDTGDVGFTRGVQILAFAVKGAPGATAEETALADAVIRTSGMLSRRPPTEAASPAQVFNAGMDAALDSANATAGAPTRAVRRVKLAAALEAAGFVLLPQAELAELVCAKLDLDDLRNAKLAAPPPVVTCCPADAAAAGGCCQGDGDRYGLEPADVEEPSGFLDHIDGGIFGGVAND